MYHRNYIEQSLYNFYAFGFDTTDSCSKKRSYIPLQELVI